MTSSVQRLRDLATELSHARPYAPPRLDELLDTIEVELRIAAVHIEQLTTQTSDALTPTGWSERATDALR